MKKEEQHLSSAHTSSLPKGKHLIACCSAH